jgi:plastocyanin
MERYGLIFALVAAVVASGCASSTSDGGSSANYSEVTSDSEIGPNTTVVNYTDSGFEPSTVEIERGETVQFVDLSGTPMWVGSNNHPRHTKYDGSSTREHCENGEAVNESVFDQCSAGETYSFTFDKTGEFGYHNHQGPRDSGTVVVS